MTADTFNMESIELLNSPETIMNLVRRVSSDERKEQLQSIIVNSDPYSLSYRIHIRMLISRNYCQEMVTDSFQVPEFIQGSGVSLIIQRCLKLMDQMTAGVDE